MSAFEPPPKYSPDLPPPAYQEQNSNWSYPVAYNSAPGNNSVGAPANPPGFVVIQNAVPGRAQDGCCRGCACCVDRHSRIICGLIFVWMIFISTLIVIPLTAAFVVVPYDTASSFVQTQCTVTSSVLGTITTTCSCGKYCTYTCVLPCDRVQVTFTTAKGAQVTATLHTDENSLSSECYNGDDSSGLCWYNPNNEQQVFRSKKFQLADAVNALLWPILVCVGSFIFIAVFCKVCCARRTRPMAVIY